MKGFTLLEVMVALAIVAGLLLTVLSSVNYHLSIVARDREELRAVLLGRAKLAEQELIPGSSQDASGTFAPDWPDIRWETRSEPTMISGFSKQTIRVIWGGERKRDIALVHYRGQ